MRANKQYDIFISYRREGGFETAQLIAQHLKHLGYDVFLDLENLRGGKFNKELLRVIGQCKDFVIILPENGLDRCVNADDWVRQELECAIKADKNIIPVLLRGFVFPKGLPAEISEVQFYNGVAASDHNYLDASLIKLKSFLKSKRGVSIAWYFAQYRLPILIVSTVILLLGGLVGYNYLQNQRHFTQLCKEQVNLMTSEFTAMNLNLNTAKRAKAEWDKFTQKLNSASPRDTAQIKRRFLETIAHFQKNLQQPNSGMGLSETDAALLSKHGIKTEDIKIYYTSVCPSYYNEVQTYLGNLSQYAQLPYASDMLYRNAQLGYDFLFVGLKGSYYALLGLFTTMPKDIYEELYKIKPQIDNFSEIPTTLSFSEYESLQESTMKAMQLIIDEMGGMLKDETLTIEAMLQKFDNTLADIGKSQVAQGLARIEEKKANIEAKRGELAEADRRLTEAYERALTKFEITADDEQWYAWGKMLRIATLAINAKTMRSEALKQYNEQVQVAKNQGLDPSFLSKPSYTMSLNEMFVNIDKWLDNYLKFNKTKDPNAVYYVATAKNFFKQVQKEAIPYQGILMVGSDNGA